MHMGNSQKCSGMFKGGKLVYANIELNDLIQRVTLQKYYNSKNTLVDSLVDVEFDTIEAAIEAISNYNLIRKWRICSCS
jgi:hypothetical protein